MDDILGIVLLVVAVIGTLATSGKKRPQGTGLPLPRRGEAELPQPMPRPYEEARRPAPEAPPKKRSLGFEVPHLKGAPPVPPRPDADGVYREQAQAGAAEAPAETPAKEPQGRVLTQQDVWVDAEGVVREPGVLASEAAERLRVAAEDAARTAAYAARRAAEEQQMRQEETAALARGEKLAAPGRANRRFSARTAREAIVLAAIIGPPKALEAPRWRRRR